MAEYIDDSERTSPAGPGGGTHGSPSYELGSNYVSWNASATDDGCVIFNGRLTQFENFSFHTVFLNAAGRDTDGDDQAVRFPITSLMKQVWVQLRVHDDCLSGGASNLDVDAKASNGSISMRIQMDQGSPGQVTMILDGSYQGPTDISGSTSFLDNTPHVCEARVIGNTVSLLIDDVSVFSRADMGTLPSGSTRRNVGVQWAGDSDQPYLPYFQHGDYPLASPGPLYTMPSLFSAGAIFAAASGTSITPVIPTGDAANDILLMQAWCNGSTTFSTPTDWNVIGTNEDSANMSSAWFWKRATGSDGNPTSTTSATGSGTIGLYGRIYVLRRCKTSGDPFEDATFTALELGTSPDSAAIDTTGANRLAAAYCIIDDDNIPLTSRPPNLWLAHGAEVESTTGGDGASTAIERWMGSAGSVASVVIGTMANDYNKVLTLAWLPVESAAAALPRSLIRGQAVRRSSNF